MRSFVELESIQEIEQFIQHHQLSFIYMSKDNCSVCHSLLPQVQSILTNYPRIQLGHVNTDHVKEVAGRWDILAVPVLLLFLDGKEISREARIVHLDLWNEKIGKIYQLVVGS